MKAYTLGYHADWTAHLILKWTSLWVGYQHNKKHECYLIAPLPFVTIRIKPKRRR